MEMTKTNIPSQNSGNKKENFTRKGVEAAQSTLLYKLVTQGASLFVTVFLIRLLSVQDYGIYNLLYSLTAMTGMLFSFGIANTLQRFMPEYYSRGEYAIADRLYRFSAAVRLLTSVAILGLVIVLWDAISPLLKINEYKSYVMLFSLIIVIHLQKGILEICLNAYFMQKYTQALTAIFTVGKGIGYCAAFYLCWDIWFVLTVDLLAYVFTFVFLEIIYHKKVPKQGGVHKILPVSERARLKRYSLFYNFNDAGAGLLDTNFDNFILALFMNPAAIGAYVFCNRIVRMAGQLSPVTYLQQVIQPLFFSRNCHKDSSHFSAFQMLLKVTYMFQIPLFCLFVLFSREIIIFVFQGKFIEYSLVVTVVALFQLLNAFHFPVGLVAQLHERVDILLYSKCFAVYNIVADLILIHYFDVMGAVIATGTAALGKNIFIWYFVRKDTAMTGIFYFFSRLLGYWILISMGISWSIHSLFENPYLILAMGGCCLALAFLFQFRFIFLNREEKIFLLNLEQNNKKISKLLQLSGLKYTAA